LKPRAQSSKRTICSVPAPFRSSSRRIQVHPANLKSSVNVFPRTVCALILLLSTDVKIFFRTIKEVSILHAWKKLPGKKAEWAPQASTGTGWQTAVPLANGISPESHQNTAIYQPATTNPGESSKDDKPTPTNPQSSGRTIRPRNY